MVAKQFPQCTGRDVMGGMGAFGSMATFGVRGFGVLGDVAIRETLLLPCSSQGQGTELGSATDVRAGSPSPLGSRDGCYKVGRCETAHYAAQTLSPVFKRGLSLSVPQPRRRWRSCQGCLGNLSHQRRRRLTQPMAWFFSHACTK